MKTIGLIILAVPWCPIVMGAIHWAFQKKKLVKRTCPWKKFRGYGMVEPLPMLPNFIPGREIIRALKGEE